MTDRDEREGAGKTEMPGREALRPPLPKRFYKAATVEGADRAYRILLDGRRVKTPGKRDFAVPSRALAEAIAGEWAAQGERIDPATMPLTRIANTVIDGVADEAAKVADDIRAFAASDLLCYRAPSNEELAMRQRAAWDPVLAWARCELGARFVLAEGVMPVEQPVEALARVRAALEALDPFRLAALHVMMTLTGSALLAIALARGRLTCAEAWAAAHIDEDWQIEQWGKDSEAEARRRHRFAEFQAASRLLDTLA